MTTFMWTDSQVADVQGFADDIKAAGIDVVMNYRVISSSGTTAMQDYLDALHAARLKACIYIANLGKGVVYSRGSKVLTAGELAAITSFVNQWKDHPACWGWYADDEGPVSNYPISTRQQVYDTIKAAHPSGMVMEVHYDLSAYSAAVHDVFGLDQYPYVYDDQTYAGYDGCISKATGLVTDSAGETASLNLYESRLSSAQATLEAAGDNYFAVMQAFKQTSAGPIYNRGMPPDGGIDAQWARVQAAGFDQFGAGWFLWHQITKTPPVTSEQLVGVGQAGYAAQLAEVTAIAMTQRDTTATATPEGITLDMAGTPPFLIERRVV